MAEALAGLVVLLVAGWFLVFAWNRSGSAVADSYELVARFPNVTGVSVGTDVRVSGMKVGRVVAQELDPKTWQAVVRMAIDRRVSLPVDSSAAITSEGLLGGSFIALMPGGEEEKLAPGDEIVDTQGATDLMGLVGAVINRTGGGGGGGAGGGARGGEAAAEAER
ncbi:outer membrane lipid asymmetry maintenance protein MlaD [Thermaurantiacus tibetensis]|uniref:outer membrane lipid asymmetry maintenance protein MlaD n=1 Tax=Thermaurantiacus tibetensis TaxID=2759035 RepID=UPI0022A881F4|nr:outer membrane lipid asymmetry maintenance protein MlaD [Thermaurantiacus tibetensis]